LLLLPVYPSPVKSHWLLLGCACWPLIAQAADGWRLVWSDEFDKDGAPDPAKWNYEEGYVRNHERQYYTRDRRENARVEKGFLIIEARKEKFVITRGGKQEPADYTSASLTTKGRADWTYGRIEVKAQLPAGRGTWPAIWTLGRNIDKVGWPACGEIDIMEFVGHQPGMVFQNVHTKGFNHTRGNGRGAHQPLADASTACHTYSLAWTPQKLDFGLDGKSVFVCANDGTGVDSWPFDAPQYLILNLAIGGAWGGQKGIDDTIFPQRLVIDFVRVYQQQ
jgi:beta-glucanase (GH16 family)